MAHCKVEREQFVVGNIKMWKQFQKSFRGRVKDIYDKRLSRVPVACLRSVQVSQIGGDILWMLKIGVENKWEELVPSED